MHENNIGLDVNGTATRHDSVHRKWPGIIKVLIVEDHPADAELMVRELRRAGFEPEWTRVDSGAAYAANLRPEPDIILSDYSIPGFTGLDALEELNKRGLDIPLIIVSGTIDEETAVAAMHQGAVDYILKDRLLRLGPAVALALDKCRLRRESEQTEEAHARLATAIEQAHESIIITDCDGIIQYVNPFFERISGYTKEELIGRNPRILKSGRHDEEFYRQMWKTLERGEDWHGRLTNKRKDGTVYEEDATISPIVDTAGKIVSYVAVKRDVSREVQLEGQFRQAQKMEAIGQLAGGVAHDFNNMLAAILMQTELLAATKSLPDEIRDGLREISTYADRAASLTRQLLLFSCRQEMHRGNLDLNELVTSLSQMLRRIIGEDMRLELNLHPEPLMAYADPGMLDQVLLNLVVNARDAMPGGGRLLIETTQRVFTEEEAASSRTPRPAARFASE